MNGVLVSIIILNKDLLRKGNKFTIQNVKGFNRRLKVKI